VAGCKVPFLLVSAASRQSSDSHGQTVTVAGTVFLQSLHESLMASMSAWKVHCHFSCSMRRMVQACAAIQKIAMSVGNLATPGRFTIKLFQLEMMVT
jgi:hypothetical protein